MENIKPFAVIQELNLLKKYLQNDKKYSKRKNLVQKEIDRVDRVHDTAQMLLNQKFSTQILGTLTMIAINNKMLLEMKGGQTDLFDIEFYLKQFLADIRYGVDLKMAEIAHTMSIPYENMILADYEKNGCWKRGLTLVSRMPKKQDSMDLLTGYLNEFILKMQNEIIIKTKTI